MHDRLGCVRCFVFSCILLCGGFAPPLAAQTGVEPIIAARAAPLRASAAGKLDTVPGGPAALGFDEAVALFYGARGDRPAWTEPRRRAALLEAMQSVYDDGLTPEHYHVAEIAAGPPQGPPQALADYDWLITHSAMLALLHLYRGKVEPATLDTHWNFQPRALDPRRGLEAFAAAVEQGEFAPLYTRARPSHWLYARLRAALTRLHAIEVAAGWPQIAAGAALKPGMEDARVPLLRARLAAQGESLTAAPDSLLYDSELESAVKRYQAAQYLDADGVIGARTLAVLNVPVAARIAQLRANLERGRWQLHRSGGDFVLVDVAGYKIALYRDGKPVWNSRVQVGQPYRSTPIFESVINTITLNPTWTVPPTVLSKDVLPKIRKDSGYLKRNRIRALDAAGRELAADDIDWNRPRGITLRQDAGPGNALGSAALRFPNAYAVYLHDTPHQALFAQSQRAFSSGCIRVERALELVELLFDDPRKWNRAAIDAAVATARTQNIALARPVPILLAYWTVDVDEAGRPAFKPDIYDRDPALIAALDRRP